RPAGVPLVMLSPGSVRVTVSWPRPADSHRFSAATSAFRCRNDTPTSPYRALTIFRCTTSAARKVTAAFVAGFRPVNTGPAARGTRGTTSAGPAVVVAAGIATGFGT